MRDSPDRQKNTLFDSFAEQLAAIDPELSPKECWGKVRLVIDQLGIGGINLFTTKFADEVEIKEDGERIIITVKKYPKGSAKKLRVLHLVFHRDVYMKLDTTGLGSGIEPSALPKHPTKTLTYMGYLSGLENPDEREESLRKRYAARVEREQRGIQADVEDVVDDDDIE